MSKYRKVILKRQIEQSHAVNLFDLAKIFYKNYNESNKKSLEMRLKDCLINTLNETNSKEINSMYFNMQSMIDVFPFVIKQHILSFLNITSPETTSIARTCKDFYQIYKNLTKQNCWNINLVPITLSLTFSNDYKNMVIFYRNHNIIDYATLKRCLQYNRSIKFEYTDGSSKQITPTPCDKFFTECQSLLSQIRSLRCNDRSCFAQFRTYGITFPELQYLHCAFDESELIKDYLSKLDES